MNTAMQKIWNNGALRASVLAGQDVADAGNWCLFLITVAEPGKGARISINTMAIVAFGASEESGTICVEHYNESFSSVCLSACPGLLYHG